jgi:hypothetical protein
MNEPMTIKCDVHFQREARGRHTIESGKEPSAPVGEPGRIPRVARLMALAIRIEGQVRSGALASYSALAALGHVTRARVSQILNLVNLAPDLQETLLFLPRTEHGRDPIHLRLLQPIAAALDWKKQRRLWGELVAARVRGLGA